jgi:hypothetical protein
MKLTVKSGGVPPGSYVAMLKGVEAKESKFGPGLFWTFEVSNGPHAGVKATAFSQPEPTANNKCGKFLAGIMGKMPGVGETVDLSPYIGKPYLIVVEKTEGGGGKVSTVTAAPTA